MLSQKFLLKPALIIYLIFSLIACTSIGPRLLPKNRIGFNDAVITSEEQQLLLNLVRRQFGDRPNFMSVESITTSNNVSVGASGSASPSPGDSRSSSFSALGFNAAGFQGGSVSGSSGGSFGLNSNVSYSDSPTVSYSPLQGEKFTRQMLAPFPITTIALLLKSGWGFSRVMRLTVEQIHDYQNPSLTFTDVIPDYQKFFDLVDYIKDLQTHNIVYFESGEVKEVTLETGLQISIPPVPSLDLIVSKKYQNSPKIKKLYALLSAPTLKRRIRFVSNRLLAEAHPEDNLILLKPRSFIDVLNYLSDAVEITPELLERGLVAAPKYPNGKFFNLSDVTKGILDIHMSNTEPTSNVNVAVFYRNHWYYIKDNDPESKRTFYLAQQLYHLQAGEISGNSSGPVLTLPVAR